MKINRKIVMLFSLSLVLGLVFSFLVFPHLGDATSGLDPDGYGAAGEALYLSGHFSPVDKAPLYPAFVAAVSWLAGGYRVESVVAAQCLLAALTCLVLYEIFQAVLPSENLAFLAALAAAVYPMSLWYIPRLWTETFLTLVIACFTLATVRLVKHPSQGRLIICGLMVGVAALSKGVALILLPLAMVVVGVRFGRRSLPWMAGLTAAALVLILPWTWRNYQVTGHFVPVHTGGGYNFYLGNGFSRHFLEAPVSYVKLKALTVADMERLPARYGPLPGDPLQADSYLLRASLDEWAANPLRAVQKLAVQSLTFWYLAADRSKSLLTGILQIPVVLLSLPGIVLAFRRRSLARLLLLPVVGIMAASVLVFAFARLSIVIMPYLIGLAVYGMGIWLPGIFQLLKK